MLSAGRNNWPSCRGDRIDKLRFLYGAARPSSLSREAASLADGIQMGTQSADHRSSMHLLLSGSPFLGVDASALTDSVAARLQECTPRPGVPFTGLGGAIRNNREELTVHRSYRVAIWVSAVVVLAVVCSEEAVGAKVSDDLQRSFILSESAAVLSLAIFYLASR